MVGEDNNDSMQDAEEFEAMFEEDSSVATQIPEADTQSVDATVTSTQVGRGSPSRDSQTGQYNR